ncbi:recombinase RmuC [Sulfobacillus thermotolerans]|uniref:Recombinase RmuC n=1 Tax=Sulfobacillus thermotolerans TaxID=338644 RepID=A0ABN5H4M1_9FIRM|nr:recombinase RmuC [Sulfobacillus thermotolerans]
MTLLEILVALSLVLNIIVMILLIQYRSNGRVSDVIGQYQKTVEQAVREELMQGRTESSLSAKMTREEVQEAFKRLGDALLVTLGDKSREQQTALHTIQQFIASNLSSLANADKNRFDAFSQETQHALEAHYRNTIAAISEMATQHKGLLDSFSKQLADLTTVNETKLEQMRTTVEQKLSALQDDNHKQLEQMRVTVDEKLHQTLEQRLGESFKLVSERLEQVHRGLGEMQTLASGVGDLKKVLANVKTRGTLGEIQLDNILEQTLSPEQYQRSVAVRADSLERVDFAIFLPGKDDDAKQVLLPIDSKFPLEDYQKLIDAEEAGDGAVAAEAGKMLENRVRHEAKAIQEKYINPPHTTDFAIMFLPVEGLFAEILRRPGLWEALQREYHVIVTGPTTITALLNSLQMGFRTLAIQKRSSEVWSLLGAVKTEFGKFGDILEKTQKKLQEASNTIDTARTRSRAIERKLRKVEAASPGQMSSLLPEGDMASLE